MSICAASLAGATKAPPARTEARLRRSFRHMPFAGTGAKKAILWIIVGLVIASFVVLDLLFALRP